MNISVSGSVYFEKEILNYTLYIFCLDFKNQIDFSQATRSSPTKFEMEADEKAIKIVAIFASARKWLKENQLKSKVKLESSGKKILLFVYTYIYCLYIHI